jgi:hypothetical protein
MMKILNLFTCLPALHSSRLLLYHGKPLNVNDVFWVLYIYFNNGRRGSKGEGLFCFRDGSYPHGSNNLLDRPLAEPICYLGWGRWALSCCFLVLVLLLRRSAECDLLLVAPQGDLLFVAHKEDFVCHEDPDNVRQR